MIKNTLTNYGLVAKLFHWIMAIVFVVMFVIAYIMINISKSDFRMSLYDLHKATGMLLFGFVGLRLCWRFINSQPKVSKSVPFWQLLAAKLNVLLLYLLMILMPISGFLTSTLGGHDISFFGIFIIAPLGHAASASAFFSDAHELMSYLFIAAFVLHVMGALYHRYFLKDGTFEMMWKKKQSGF